VGDTIPPPLVGGSASTLIGYGIPYPLSRDYNFQLGGGYYPPSPCGRGQGEGDLNKMQNTISPSPSPLPSRERVKGVGVVTISN